VISSVDLKEFPTKEHMADVKWFANKVVDVLSEFDISKDAKIADLGCQNGVVLSLLKKNGYSKITGYDIERQKRFPKGVKFFRADLNVAKLKEKYDIILSSEVMEHLENPYHFMKICSKHLKKRGKLIITTPNQQKFMDKVFFFVFGENTRFRIMRNNRVFLTRRILNAMIRENKFKIVKWSYNYSKLPGINSFSFFPTRWFGNSHYIILEKL